MKSQLCGGLLILLSALIGIVDPTCVLESDFGFKINCAFKKSGLFRVRNLGGLKAHASLGFSLGDELGFEQSLTNLDPSRRRSVNVRNGVPPNLVGTTSRPAAKQEKRGKQNRIMMRPAAPSSRPNPAAMDKLSTLHRRIATTMQPIVVPSVDTPSLPPKATQGLTMAKPMPMGIPAFKPLPPKEDTLKVVPISTTKNTFPQVSQAKGPGLAYQSENYPQSHNQISKMVAQMTAGQYSQPQLIKITPTPIIIQSNTPKLYPLPTTVNPFIPMPVAAPPTQAISIIPAPTLIQTHPQSYRPVFNTVQNPVSNFIDPGPQRTQELAEYVYNTKKVDEYNTITGYGDDTALKFDKEDINSKIVEIAKAGNISMEAVEAAIALRQQQLLSKYANMPVPTTSTTTTTTTTTEEPFVFQPQPEPEIVVASPQKPKRNPTVGKVMNAPREYYPVGYEKNFDDHFQSKVDLPETDFHCGDQKYFPGLYGDEGLGCMVFHVCALTDEGLVMKSFLCPESTLFDQTILKCNWWFYVDCRSTARLYDTNIPVSKSYQLMKALTFFSSYKKNVQEDANQPANPEDVDGIKEAISILENQKQTTHTLQADEQSNIQIITPQPIIDERNNHRTTSTENSPVYRATRNYNSSNSTRRSSPKNRSNESSSELKQDTIYASSSKENITKSESERKHRRRMTLKNTPVNFNSKATPTTTTTEKTLDTSTPTVEIVKQEIQPIESFNIANAQQRKLIEELKDLHKIDETLLSEAENAAPVKRFYRSSAEKDSKEVAYVNNEKVQIVRPTSMVKLVGDYQTPTTVIAKLDEAVVGIPYSRVKKSPVSIVTPVNHENYRIHTKDQT